MEEPKIMVGVLFRCDSVRSYKQNNVMMRQAITSPKSENGLATELNIRELGFAMSLYADWASKRKRTLNY